MEFLIEALWAFQWPLCNGTFVFVFLSDTVRVARKTQICSSLEWFSIPFVSDSFGFSALVLEGFLVHLFIYLFVYSFIYLFLVVVVVVLSHGSLDSLLPLGF